MSLPAAHAQQAAPDPAAEPTEARIAPGPLWPTYQLSPGPLLEPAAYVVHPATLEVLLVKAGVDLPACNERLSTCEARVPPPAVQPDSPAPCRDCPGWTQRLQDGAIGFSVGVLVAGAVLLYASSR